MTPYASFIVEWPDRSRIYIRQQFALAAWHLKTRMNLEYWDHINFMKVSSFRLIQFVPMGVLDKVFAQLWRRQSESNGINWLFCNNDWILVWKFGNRHDWLFTFSRFPLCRISRKKKEKRKKNKKHSHFVHFAELGVMSMSTTKINSLMTQLLATFLNAWEMCEMFPFGKKLLTFR